MCLHISGDSYLLQVKGWALTEYGENRQSLVNKLSLNIKFIHCTFFREIHCHLGSAAAQIQYIILHYE